MSNELCKIYCQRMLHFPYAKCLKKYYQDIYILIFYKRKDIIYLHNFNAIKKSYSNLFHLYLYFNFLK